MNLEFRPQARLEFDEAADWYEEQEAGMRAEFVYAVDAAIRQILLRPKTFPIIQGTVIRRALVRKFPYVILFSADEQLVLIRAVFHTSRNPLIWRRRT